MGQQAHTPGPWQVHQGNDYTCVLRPNDWTDSAIQVDNAGDARLIAAAPDLLAALRELLLQLEEHDERNREPECTVCQAVAAGHAAIAKATGSDA